VRKKSATKVFGIFVIVPQNKLKRFFARNESATTVGALSGRKLQVSKLFGREDGLIAEAQIS
jgi:hypothetical protein